jgi:hypothetical protein
MAETRKMIALSMSAALMAQVAGCGTLMHPERKGQRSGDVDAGVAVLDGLGLLFFIIPGVIAFAVDFSNGTIYLPPGPRHASADTAQLRRVSFDPRRATAAEIEAMVSNETGHSIKLDQGQARVVELRSREEMTAWFARTAGGEPAPR